MEPENPPPLEKKKHLQTTNNMGSMLVFGGVPSWKLTYPHTNDF